MLLIKPFEVGNRIELNTTGGASVKATISSRIEGTDQDLRLHCTIIKVVQNGFIEKTDDGKERIVGFDPAFDKPEIVIRKTKFSEWEIVREEIN
jgi:hypothetical protein